MRQRDVTMSSHQRTDQHCAQRLTMYLCQPLAMAKPSPLTDASTLANGKAMMLR